MLELGYTGCARAAQPVRVSVPHVSPQVLAQIELQEGKKAMGEKKYVKRDGGRRTYKRSTASVLRLIDPFADCFPLHVRADSYFSSVDTAIAMVSRGCHYSGPVKQAYSKFPLAWLRKQVADGARGGAAFATTDIMDENGDTFTLRAAAWKDHTVQCFVSTRGLSEPGEPAEKSYMRSDENNVDVLQVFEQVPRPALVQETHDCLAAWYACTPALPTARTCVCVCVWYTCVRVCARVCVTDRQRCAATSTTTSARASSAWRTTSARSAGGTEPSAHFWAW